MSPSKENQFIDAIKEKKDGVPVGEKEQQK